MMACVMPIVEDRSSESSPPGRLNEVILSQKQEGIEDQEYYLVNTGFPASVRTKYSRGRYREAKDEMGDITDVTGRRRSMAYWSHELSHRGQRVFYSAQHA